MLSLSKILYWIVIFPILYIVGTVLDMYFSSFYYICKKLKIGVYRKLTPYEFAEVMMDYHTHLDGLS